MQTYHDTPAKVEFKGDYLFVTLHDGRIIGNPIAWFPFLANATLEQRQHYELGPWMIEWPDLGDGLSTDGMLKGMTPAMKKWIPQASMAE